MPTLPAGSGRQMIAQPTAAGWPGCVSVIGAAVRIKQSAAVAKSYQMAAWLAGYVIAGKMVE